MSGAVDWIEVSFPQRCIASYSIRITNGHCLAGDLTRAAWDRMVGNHPKTAAINQQELAPKSVVI